jgi:tripartite-type tricarboxylate transporter receptor subunit TctC
MKKLLIVFLSVFFVVTVAPWGDGVQAAEKYPVRPITYVMTVEAGGGADLSARPLCEKLGSVLGQPIMVVNKPGAGSSIGNREIHDARPNGYTVGVGTATIVTNKLLGLLPYDYRDYTVLGAYQKTVPAIVAATKGKRTFKTLQEVVEFARLHPGEVSIAAGAKGQMWWLAAMEFQAVSGAKFNIIPQEGAGGFSITQVAGGHVDIGVLGVSEGKPMIDAGNARLLAIYGNTPPHAYPNAPTLDGLGFKCKTSTMASVIGPPNMPKEITEVLIKAVEIAAKDPDYRKIVEERSSTVCLYLPPEQAIEDYAKLREIFRDILGNAGLLKEK